MAVLTNARVRVAPRELPVGMPPRRSPAPRTVRRVGARGAGVGVDRRRPPRLIAAPVRAAAVPCERTTVAGPIGWLLMVGVLAFLVVLGIGLSAGGGQGAAPVPEHTVLVQVRQGETLWAVAQRMAPSASASVVVDRIRRLNGLAGDSVYPGELLQVPSSAPAGAVRR